jgi:type IV secretion system protein VirB4
MRTIESIELNQNQDTNKLGFSDLLLYSHFIEDGIIYNWDGSYQKSFWCNGFEFESSEMHEKLGITRYLNLIFAAFETGWVIHVNSIRVKINEYINEDDNHFDNSLLEAMEAERKFYFIESQSLFKNKTAITLTYLPQNKSFNKLGSKFKETNKKSKEYDPYSFYLESFKERVEQAVRLISRALRLTPMDSNETLSYLHYLISGKWTKLQLSPSSFVELRHFLAEDFIGGFEPKIGDSNIRVISIDQGFPEESQPLILERLNNLNFEFRWSTRFFFLTNTESRDNIQHLSDLHQQNILSPTASIAARSGISANINRSAYDLFDEAEEAKRASVISGINHGKYNCCVILYSEDESVLADRVKQVRQVFDELQFKNRLETMGAMQTYLGSLDGEIYKNRRRFLVSTENLVEFMPLSGAWSGYEQHPSNMYPENSPPLFYVDTPIYGVFKGSLHWHDMGHTLILGTNGTGKSTLLLFLSASQLRYKNSQVFAFDYKRSMMPFTYGVDGEHYDIGSDDTMFQPFAEVDTMRGFVFAVEWVSLICELNHLHLTSEHISAIHDGIAALRQLPVELRTMHAFYMHVSGVHPEVAEVFKAYQGEDTLKAKVFSANQDRIKLNRFNVFEMSEVMDKGESTVIPVLKYLFHKIMSQLDGRPTTIIIEESWMAFNNPTFSKELAKWLDTMRKLNTNIVLVTTNITQVAKSSIKDTLLQQCMTTILTPNVKLDKDLQTREAYTEFGLNPRQLDILSKAQAKRQYYFMNPDGCKLFNLDMDSFVVSKAFFCRISIEDLIKAKELKKYYQENFAKKWLEYCGLPAYATQL